jgi:hypothetical protein
MPTPKVPWPTAAEEEYIQILETLRKINSLAISSVYYKLNFPEKIKTDVELIE